MSKKSKKENTQTQNKETNKDGAKVAGVGFGGELKQELDKIVWPSRQQLISESVAVILMVILVATTIYLIDSLFSWGAGKVF